MIFGYCRAFGFEPQGSLSGQSARLRAAGAQEIFSETARLFGETPQLRCALGRVAKGDVLIVTRPYRLALTQRGVVAIIDQLARKGGGLRILDTPIDTSTTTGRMLIGSAPMWSLGISPWRALISGLSPRRHRHLARGQVDLN